MTKKEVQCDGFCNPDEGVYCNYHDRLNVQVYSMVGAEPLTKKNKRERMSENTNRLLGKTLE